MRRLPLCLSTLTLCALLLLSCQHAPPDREALFAGACADGETSPCRTIFTDQSAAAKAARVEDFLVRFSRAQASAQPAEMRIEIADAPAGGTVIRCHGPQAACADFFQRYQAQPTP
jgi:hypothetical protein